MYLVFYLNFKLYLPFSFNLYYMYIWAFFQHLEHCKMLHHICTEKARISAGRITILSLWEIDHHTGVLRPLRTVCLGSLTSHRIYKCKGIVGPDLLFIEKTRKSALLQMYLQRQHFLLSFLITLLVGPAGVWIRIWIDSLPLGRPSLFQLS